MSIAGQFGDIDQNDGEVQVGAQLLPWARTVDLGDLRTARHPRRALHRHAAVDEESGEAPLARVDGPALVAERVMARRGHGYRVVIRLFLCLMTEVSSEPRRRISRLGWVFAADEQLSPWKGHMPW
jgi:hypothetical protein